MQEMMRSMGQGKLELPTEQTLVVNLASPVIRRLTALQEKGVYAFEVEGSGPQEQRARAWRLIDATRLMSITANLGDTRTTITHPASTTHSRLSAQQRAEVALAQSP